MKALLKYIPFQTIIGWFFPDLMAKFEVWQSAKTPESLVALGEAAAEALAAQFKPDLLPAIKHYEEVGAPAIESIIVAVETPSIKSVEVAAISVGKALAQVLGSKSTPDEIEAAAIAFVNVLNKEVGV